MKQNNNDNIMAVIDAERENLFRMACYRIGNIDDSADIVQETLLKVWRRKDFINIRDVKKYLYRGVLNACVSYINRSEHGKFVPLSNDIVSDESENKSFFVEYQQITVLLENIPQEQREVILLRTISGKSFQEIAEIQNLTIPTVKSRFRYGIEKIRKIIYKQFKDSQDNEV